MYPRPQGTGFYCGPKPTPDKNMATIDIRGVPHAYELTNPTQSPHVLVFMHGWLLSRNYWQPLIQKLSADYRKIGFKASPL